MIKNFRGIMGTWVFSTETSPALPLGKIVDIVVDPLPGQCVALWIQTLDGLRLIDFRDIQRWDDDIYVSSQKDILKPEDFPKISAILEREVPIISAPVWVENVLEKSREKIGIVQDFTVEMSFPVILSIKVNTGWWIFGKKIEIPRKRILKIDETGILVSNNLIKESEIKTEKTEEGVVFSSSN